jgi:hypothetical protein
VIFSVWDQLAGTNYIPRVGEQYQLGIGAESAKFRSVCSLYFYPFVTAARRLRGRAVFPALRSEVGE